MGIDLRQRRLETNALSLLVGRVVGALSTTAIFSISAYQLSDQDFGLVVSVLAAGFLANSLVTFGTDTLITRQIAAKDHGAISLARTALRLQLIAALVFSAGAAVAWATGAPALLLVQALVLVPQAVTTVAGAVLRGREQMTPLATSSIAAAMVALGTTLLGFAVSTTPAVPVIGLALGALVAATVLARAAAQTVSAGHKPDGAESTAAVKSLLRTAAPFAAMVVLAAVGAQGGLLLVEFATSETTGGYGAAVRLTEAGRLVPAAVIGAFFPAMVNGTHYTQRYRRWVQGLVGYTVAVTIALVATADVINRIFFDAQPDGAAIIQILAASLVLTLARLALSFEAIAEGHERRVVLSALAGTAVLVVAGLALAPAWGARGVAVGQVLGIATAVAYLAAARRNSSTPSTDAAIGVRESPSGHG